MSRVDTNKEEWHEDREEDTHPSRTVDDDDTKDDADDIHTEGNGVACNDCCWELEVVHVVQQLVAVTGYLCFSPSWIPVQRPHKEAALA